MGGWGGGRWNGPGARVRVCAEHERVRARQHKPLLIARPHHHHYHHPAGTHLPKVPDAAAGRVKLLHARKGVEVLGNVGHDGPLIRLDHIHNVLYPKELGDAQVLLGHVKGQLGVPVLVALVQGMVVQQVRAVAVDEAAAGV